MAGTASNSGAPFVSMISHFSSREREDHAGGWSALWDAGRNDMWDRGKPSPGLVALVESKTSPLPTRHTPGKRKPTALVPGCGKGYDVVMLALHGYNAYGLDVSPTGVETARRYAATQFGAPSEDNFSSARTQEEYSAADRGQAGFVVGDFFTKDWEADCHPDNESFVGFDLIYDYTFLCALLPEMRKDWARRMSELLAPSGLLICLEFPLYKDLKLPGPPWGLREGIYWDLLVAGGNGIIDDEVAAQTATQTTTGGAFKRLSYIKPERSHEIAKGTDMLSIWTLKEEDSSG